MKTAVEWLIEKLDNNLDINHSWKTRQYIKQAKEMDKEQMCKFASDYVETQCSASFDGSISVDITTEEYYNLTFKSE